MRDFVQQISPASFLGDAGGAAPAPPAPVPFLIEEQPNLGAYFDERDLADGAVAAWPGRGPWPQTLVQATAAAQPIKGSALVTFDGANDKLLGSVVTPRYVGYTAVPDAQGSTAGRGFSNNGIVRGPDGTYWLTNGGLARENLNNSLRRQSIVQLSADFTTKLREIDLYTLADGVGAGGGSAPRGLAYRTATNTLLTSWGSNVIEIGDITGTPYVIRTLAIAASSVSYDPNDDTLWVLQTSNSTLRKHSLVDGSQIRSMSSGGESYQDHVCYVPEWDQLIVFCGDNDGQCFIAVKDATTGRTMAYPALPSLLGAIEQGCVVGRKLFVNSNGYYHSPSGTPVPQVNRVIEYDLPPPWAAKRILAFGIFSVASVSTQDFLFGSEQSTKWRGWSLMTTGLTTLRLFMHTGGDDTAVLRTGKDCTVSSLTVPHIYCVEFEVGVGITLWVDGVQRDFVADTVCTGNLRSDFLRVAQARDPNFEGRLATKAIGYYVGGGDRVKTEGRLAHDHGMTGVLAADHPHKVEPPFEAAA